MKRVLMALGIVALVLMAGLVGAWLYFDSQYGISRAPRLSYGEVLGQQYPIRAVVQPIEAREEILAHLADSGIQVPAVALDRVLPQEIAILAKPDPAHPEFDLSLFINEQSFGPVIHAEVNRMLGAAPPSQIQWASGGVIFPKRGVLTLEGTLPVEPDVFEATAAIWSDSKPRPPLPMDGDHFIEALIDNRDGVAHSFVLLLLGDQRPDPNIPDDRKTVQQRMVEAQMQVLTNSLKMTSNIHLAAEPAEDADALDVTLTVVCTGESGRSGPESVKTLLDTGVNQGAPFIQSEYGYDFSGKSRIEGQTVVGEYRIQPFSKMLARIMAPQAPTPQTVPAN